MGCHFLLQGIFLTQGSNLGLPHCRQILYHLNHEGVLFSLCESESEVTQLYPTLCNPWTVAHQAPLSMGFSRQEYWSGLPFPSPGDLPNPGIKPGSPALQADPLPSEPPGKPSRFINDSYSELPFQSPDFEDRKSTRLNSSHAT